MSMTRVAALAAGLLLAACAPAAPVPTTTPTAAPPTATATATSTAGAPTPSTTAGAVGLRLVAIGDSIPFNSPQDCPGCTGFVDRYADAVAAAAGRTVEVSNLSKHTGLTLPQLLASLGSLEPALAQADVIVVGIAHNSMELNADEPCGAPVDENEMPDWNALTEQCAVEAAERYRPQFNELYSRIAALRAGKPTLLRTINRYNDWIGDGDLTAEQAQKTKLFIDRWNAVLCDTAEQNGFGCADIYHRFNGADGLTPSGDLLTADYTHPSDRGNELIAHVLAELGFAPISAPSGGPWILFQAVYGGPEAVDLGLVKPDGSGAHRVPGGPGNRWHPDWSPDGTHIAYDHNFPDVSAPGEFSSRLGLIDLVGQTEAFLTECALPCKNHQAPAWSPDGRFIGFDGWEQEPGQMETCFLARLELSSGDITRILEWPGCDSNEDDPDRPLSEGIRMRFSPDGEHIIFMGEGPHNQWAIFTATLDGQDVRQLTDWGLGARPDWSPDGEWIVFQSVEEPHSNLESRLYRVRPDGTDLQQLTAPGGTITDLYPRYLPDGTSIIFSRCLSLWVCETHQIGADGRTTSVCSASSQSKRSTSCCNPLRDCTHLPH
jgi:Tol biopolymer transport system component/lysophospholipase L1-like esterase